jgi:hypothetical protein
VRIVCDVYFYINLRCYFHEVGKFLFSLNGILGYISAFIVLYEGRQVYGDLFMVMVLDAISCFVSCAQQV